MTAAADPSAPSAIASLAARKAAGAPIVMVTAYDYPSARSVEQGGVDAILVGDSAATTILGYSSTREVTFDEMLVLLRAARRGVSRTLFIGDLPYGTYEESDALARTSARRLVDAGCDAVKLEGAGPMCQRVRAIVAAGIPVMGHVGLTPQAVTPEIGYRAHGRTASDALEIVNGARELEAAGCFSLVVEAVAAPVGEAVTRAVKIPVIGIGAGPGTDGQVLVLHDLVGLTDAHNARFVKQYARIGEEITNAVSAFAGDVRERRYPAPEHDYGMPAGELELFRQGLTHG